jgi:hypothetical protein
MRSEKHREDDGTSPCFTNPKSVALDSEVQLNHLVQVCMRYNFPHESSETCPDPVESLQHVHASIFAGLRFLVGIVCSNLRTLFGG